MVKYITGQELAAIIKSDKIPLKDYLVVDVRDDDYKGGNIPKGQNWPSYNFMWAVDELVEKTKDVKMMVFHCTFSQERGPKAARIYEEKRNQLLAEGTDSPPEVLVLRGGFSKFQAKFKVSQTCQSIVFRVLKTRFQDDPALVENWDKNVWAAGWD
jgi:Cdc25 family phosphatase